MALTIGLLLVAAGAAAAQVDRRHTETLLAPWTAELGESAVISPDGRRIAYVKASAGRQAVVLDGHAQPAYDRVAALTFSLNSKWLVYAASSAGQWQMIVNSVERRAVSPGRAAGVQPPIIDAWPT